MFKQIIKSRRLTIFDQDIKQSIIERNIKSLKYVPIIDHDDLPCLIAKLGLDHTIFFSGQRIYTSTPSILIPFIGVEMTMYSDYLNASPGELFRIKEIIEVKPPYFSANSFSIPADYFNTHFNYLDTLGRVSFNMNQIPIIEDGCLMAKIVMDQNGEYLNYRLYKDGNCMRVKSINKLLDFMYSHNKKPEAFEYEKILDDKTMVFKERIYNE